MSAVVVARKSVVATVDQVMPCLGLAYVVDDDRREWAVTRSTAGPAFETLECGRRVLLHVARHDRYCLVTSYGHLS